jgi:arginase family enzyme
MPVAMLAGLVHEHLGCDLNLKSDIIFMGIRSFEQEEYDLIKNEKVPVI